MSEQTFYRVNGVMNESKVSLVEHKIKVHKDTNTDKLVSEVKLDENITAKFYLSNLSKRELKTDELLILYSTVNYYRARFGGSLFAIYFYFKLDETLTSMDKILNGKFSFRIVFKTSESKLDVEYEKFNGNESVIELITTLLKSEDMRGILDELSENIEEERRKKYPPIDYKIPKATITRKDLENL